MPLYKPHTKYICQVQFQVSDAANRNAIEYIIDSEKIPEVQAGIWLKGVLVATSPTTIQNVSPWQIKTVFFIEITK